MTLWDEVIIPSRWKNSWETGFSSDLASTVTASRSISSWVCAAVGNSPTIHRTKKQLPAPSPTKKIWSDGVRCNIASPNNSINIHHLQLVDINHFEAEFTISWGRCPCSFWSFPLQKCPWITCHLFVFGGMVTLLKRVEGFTSPSNIYIRYSQLISFMSSVSVTPPWSYTNQQVMLMDWIPICGQHLKSFGWLISCKQWIRWSCHRLQICQETYFVHILNRWYIYIYTKIYVNMI